MYATRSTVRINITVSTLSFVYYVIANRFMPEPSFSNVQSQNQGQQFNLNLTYSDPIYGVRYVKRTPKNITFTVTGLTPDMDYDVYIHDLVGLIIIF